MKKLQWLFVLLIVSVASFAQVKVNTDVLVSGTVTSADGEVLQGATVSTADGQTWAMTDTEGHFSISVSGKDEVKLVFRFLGFITQEAVVKPPYSKLNIVLQPDVNMMETVVVNGYQSIKRESATGSYNVVSTKDLESNYTGTLSDRLEGKVAGLLNYNNGDSQSFIIRGVGTFQASTEPLVVVDGLPIEGSIDTINPYDVESVTVLKDASASAIYGARASNGVIVVTTKRANSNKVAVDFNTDITISEKNDYSYYNLANAEEVLKLEKYNFDKMAANPSGFDYQALLEDYAINPTILSIPTRLMLRNKLGEISDADMNAQFSAMKGNDYYKEYQDAIERNQIQQHYNLGLRVKGDNLNSNIVINWLGDNLGIRNEKSDELTFSYHGDLAVNKWMDLSFGANVLNTKTKTHGIYDQYSEMTSFMPYRTMYNPDGSRMDMEANIELDDAILNDPENGLMPYGYNVLDEYDMNYQNAKTTNLRTYVATDIKPFDGFEISAKFQYENIISRSELVNEAKSYRMRDMYNLYSLIDMVPTEVDYDPFTYEPIYEDLPVVNHYIPKGGLQTSRISEGSHLTGRLQASYQKTFADKHSVNVLAGIEARRTQTYSNTSLTLGYDPQTLSNNQGLVNFGQMKDRQAEIGVLDRYYMAYGAPDSDDFSTTDVLHRYFSWYVTGNYVYDRRFAAQFSYRVDKTDLFGTDPKFRSRPLWSVGLGWNLHNEEFLSSASWINVLKVRASYGLTGNIDKNVSSYLVAEIGTNGLTGERNASLQTPPNNQLRWEKTATTNFGVDYSFFGNRLRGSLDFYHKYSTDLLTLTDLDATTGWKSLTINNGKARNNGVELQVAGDFIQAKHYGDLGISASLNLSYNDNKVIAVYTKPSSGLANLYPTTLHEGYPINSLFSFRYGGLIAEDDTQYITWKNAAGEIQKSSINNASFTIEDAVYSGSLIPKLSASFTPEISYKGFSLAALFTFYGGHVMHAMADRWSTPWATDGYFSDLGLVYKSALNYWEAGANAEADKKFLRNGFMADGGNIVNKYYTQYLDCTVLPADMLKLRSLTLGYSFSPSVCKALNVGGLRLRAQASNVFTKGFNAEGINPETVNAVTGEFVRKLPRSYTFSVQINF